MEEMTPYGELIDDVKVWEHGKGTAAKRPKELVAELESLGFQVIDTRGLPFNGTTYEVRRVLPDIPNAYQVCGHFKHVRQIYGNGLTFYFYPPDCRGAWHLNKDEIDRWTYKISTFDP